MVNEISLNLLINSFLCRSVDSAGLEDLDAVLWRGEGSTAPVIVAFAAAVVVEAVMAVVGVFASAFGWLDSIDEGTGKPCIRTLIEPTDLETVWFAGFKGTHREVSNC